MDYDYYDYCGYESLRGHTGKFLCDIVQVCKNSYDYVYDVVGDELSKQLAYEKNKYYVDSVLEEYDNINSVTALKRFVREHKEYFDYRVVFKNVDVFGNGKRVFCMLRPIG